MRSNANKLLVVIIALVSFAVGQRNPMARQEQVTKPQEVVCTVMLYAKPKEVHQFTGRTTI